MNKEVLYKCKANEVMIGEIFTCENVINHNGIPTKFWIRVPLVYDAAKKNNPDLVSAYYIMNDDNMCYWGVEVFSKPNVEVIKIDVPKACLEIARLRAENMELKARLEKALREAGNER